MRKQIVFITIFLTIGVMVLWPNFGYAFFEEALSGIGSSLLAAGQTSSSALTSFGSTLDQSVNAFSTTLSHTIHTTKTVLTRTHDTLSAKVKSQNAKLQLKTQNLVRLVAKRAVIASHAYSPRWSFGEAGRQAGSEIPRFARDRLRNPISRFIDNAAGLLPFARNDILGAIQNLPKQFVNIQQGAASLISSLRGSKSDRSNPEGNNGSNGIASSVASLLPRNDDEKQTAIYASTSQLANKNKTEPAVETQPPPSKREKEERSSPTLIERVIERVTTVKEVLTPAIVSSDSRVNKLITDVADLTSRVDEKDGSPYRNSALFNMISQSQRIKTLDDVKITNATIEGYASSKSVSDTYLPLGGGTLTGGLTGTSLTLSNILNASSTAHFTATSTFGNLIRVEGTGTSTILGRLSISATSTIAGYKICTQENNVCAGGAFTSSGGYTTLRTASDLVGIGTSTPGEKLSINGGAFFDSDIIRYGSSSQPTLNFRYFASSTSTLPNLTSAFTYATSTTNTPLLTLSTKSSRYGRVGIGTSSPSALFAINALNSSNQADNIFYVGSSTANVLSVDSHGFVGIGTSSHSAYFSLYVSSGSKRIFSIGSSTNSFFIIDADGHVAIGTTTNTAELNVTGTINAKAYNVGGTKVLPNGFIAYYTGSCPTGWTEYTTARGRYVVGTPASGTGEATVGTALTNTEQRVTGKHGHSISDPGHTHGFTGEQNDASSVAASQRNWFAGSGGSTGAPTTASNTTGITITATSSVNGTNAPYVQLTACKAPAGSDYAEYYPTRDPSLLPGELVALDRDNPGMIKRYNESHEIESRKNILVGIVSTQPGYVIGNLFEKEGENGIYQRPVALNGRTLVRVSLENGPIFVGDRIAPSLTPGVGRKANPEDQMVGIALQPFNEALRTEGIEAIEVFIRFSSSDVDDGIAAIAAGSSTSDVSAATSDVFPPAWTIDQITGKLTTTYGLDLGGNSIQNVSAIMSASGRWRVDESGKLVVTEIQSEKLKVKSAVEFGSQEKPIGVTIYDKATGLPYCSSVINGAAQLEPGICGGEMLEPASP